MTAENNAIVLKAFDGSAPRRRQLRLFCRREF
jgi:hypothetical protein